jgi:thiamine biosynthesis lipoprotein
MPIGRVVVGVALFAFGAFRLPAQERRFDFAQIHMGMEVRLVLYADDTSRANAAATAAFDRIRKLEDTMSDYRDKSEVRRISERPGEWIAVSPDLFAVLAQAVTMAERTEGAFDPTIGPVVALWRQARREGRLPARSLLEAARVKVGWRLLELDPAQSAVRLAQPGMALDLGAIAKGYILDRAMAAARSAGIDRILLVAGGDMIAADPPPGLKGWRIEVPGAGPEMTVRAASLANAALSTSGDSEQFVVIDGVRYSHVVDPRTGMALTHRRQAWVIAPSGVTADGLATALTVADSAAIGHLLSFYPGVLVEIVRADSSSTPGSRPSRSGP